MMSTCSRNKCAIFLARLKENERIYGSFMKRKALKVSELARMLGLSCSHVRRLAAAGGIPETIKTKGGHFRFRDTPCLRDWIASQCEERGQKQRPFSRGKTDAKSGKARAEPRAERSFLGAIQECCQWLARITADTPIETKRFVLNSFQPLLKSVERLRSELNGGIPGKGDTKTRDSL